MTANVVLLLALITAGLFVHSSVSFVFIPASLKRMTSLYTSRVNPLSMSTVLDTPPLTSTTNLRSAFFVKEATANDVESIVSLRVTTFYPETCMAGMSNDSIKRRITDTFRQRCREGSVSFVAQDVGGIWFRNLLGTVEVSPGDFKGTDMEHIGAKKKLYLVDLCVRESSRNMGIASSLLRAIEEYAASEGFLEVYMHVEVGNIAAKNLYMKKGYSAITCDRSIAFTERRLKRPADGFVLLCKRIPGQL